MTDQQQSPRRIHCSRCGAAFTCGLGASCWCMEEAVRMPMPDEGEDCLCPDCLRSAAPMAATK